MKNNSLSTKLCKKVLSASMASLVNVYTECILIMYEPKQPENLSKVELKQIRDSIR